LELWAAIWQGSASVGGGIALAFIVALALGMIVLTVLYCASAVVVLEGFARVSTGMTARVASGAGAGFVASAVFLQMTRPELGLEPWSAWWAAMGQVLGPGLGLALLAMGAVSLLLKRVDSSRGGGLLQLVALLSGATLAGARGLPELPLALAMALACGLAVAGLRRRYTGRGVASPRELQLRGTVLILVAGSLVALMGEVPRERFGDLSLAILAVLGVGVFLGLLPLAIAGLVGMFGSVEWFIATRYLVARRKQVFISAITAICILGIAAGVWLIVVVLSVMNGFEETWRDEILGNRAHFVLENEDGAFADYEAVLERVEAVPGVVAASPFVDADAMIRGRGGEIYTVRVRGVDTDRVAEVTRLGQDMVSGSLASLEATPDRGSAEAEGEGEEVEPPAPGIVIGNQLATALGVDVGDSLVLISPFGGPPTPLGPSPRLARFQVEGVFRSSFYQFDEAFAYVAIEAAQGFRRVGDVIDGVEGLTTDHYRSRRVADAVRAELGYPFSTRDWKEFFPAFFQALKTERIMMFMLLTMIMVVAAFVIVATLIMMIMEKSGDIAILKAMGAEDALVERIFALEGTLIGLAGTSIGVVAALAVTHRLGWIQDRIESFTGVDALPAGIYQFSNLPSRLDPLQVAGVVAIAMVLSLGATLLPSRQGARIDPAEGLRHE
jgi:lipoprotein-releasing system permease protein